MHSTPRKTASKIQHKKQAKSAESEEQRNLRHAEAFRDLETPVHELYLMGEIVSEIPGGGHEDQKELEHFSIYRLCEMIRDFRAKYRADLRAEAQHDGDHHIPWLRSARRARRSSHQTTSQSQSKSR